MRKSGDLLTAFQKEKKEVKKKKKNERKLSGIFT